MKKEASLAYPAAFRRGLRQTAARGVTTGGLKANPPSTKLGKYGAGSLPAVRCRHSILKSGEVSQLISAERIILFTRSRKDTLRSKKVHEEIHNALRQQKMQDSMQAVQQLSNPVLDEKYFGEGSAGPSNASPARSSQAAGEGS